MRTGPLLAVALALCGCGAPPAGSGVYLIEGADGRPHPFVRSHALERVVARSTRGEGSRSVACTSRGPGLAIGTIGVDETVELWVAGHRPLTLPLPAPAGPIVLQRGIPVTLRVESGAALPSAPLELQLEFRWRGPGDLPEAPILSDFGGVVLDGVALDPLAVRAPRIVVTDARSEVSLRASFPGRYRVMWAVYKVRREPGVYVGSGVQAPENGLNVTIEDRDTPQVLTLRIPAGALEAAVAYAGR